MKHFTPRRHNVARKIGKAAALFTTAALLVALPLVSSAQKPDKNAKAQTEQPQSTNGSFVVSDTAIINSHRRAYEAQLRERGITKMPVLDYKFSTKFPSEIPESFTVANPQGDIFCVLTRQETERLQANGSFSTFGGVLVLGKDDTINCFDKQ